MTKEGPNGETKSRGFALGKCGLTGNPHSPGPSSHPSPGRMVGECQGPVEPPKGPSVKGVLGLNGQIDVDQTRTGVRKGGFPGKPRGEPTILRVLYKETHPNQPAVEEVRQLPQARPGQAATRSVSRGLLQKFCQRSLNFVYWLLALCNRFEAGMLEQMPCFPVSHQDGSGFAISRPNSIAKGCLICPQHQLSNFAGSSFRMRAWKNTLVFSSRQKTRHPAICTYLYQFFSVFLDKVSLCQEFGLARSSVAIRVKPKGPYPQPTSVTWP